MMHNLSITDRPSYPKTECFWNMIKSIQDHYRPGTNEYSIVLRDKMIFSLCYSYGLRPEEAIKITIDNILLEENQNLGCIYIVNNGNYRLIHPIYDSVFDEIHSYYMNNTSAYRIFNSTNTLITAKGNPLTLQYLVKRLKYYNSKIPFSNGIDSIYTFRQLYIYDLLRTKGISNDFINNQIGNCIQNNLTYKHLLPQTNEVLH